MIDVESSRSVTREFIVFLFAAVVTVGVIQAFFASPAKPTLDALRYVDYALNIHDHGTFGLTHTRRDIAPQPGNANSPLYPALVAGVLSMDSAAADSLRCVVAHPTTNESACEFDMGWVRVVQSLLAIAALGCFWISVRSLFNSALIAWTGAGLVLASTKLIFFANHLLTEIVVLFLFSVMMLILVRIGATARCRWYAALGVTVGALALTRPEYLYLAYAFVCIGAIRWMRSRSAVTGLSLVILIAAFLATTGPWMTRNHHHFDSPALTGGYGDIVIAYRCSYNRLAWNEWLAAFVYWLPGHGEALAARWLPPASYAKLGTDPESYLYADGIEIFNSGLAAVGGERDQLLGHLIRTEIVAHPLLHAWSSIPLAWRGILAGKYLAVAGVPCLILLTVVMLRRRATTFAWLLLPALVMIALYATVSVSIPRYNVYLIYYYALAVAWAIQWIGSAHKRGDVSN